MKHMLMFTRNGKIPQLNVDLSITGGESSDTKHMIMVSGNCGAPVTTIIYKEGVLP